MGCGCSKNKNTKKTSKNKKIVRKSTTKRSIHELRAELYARIKKNFKK